MSKECCCIFGCNRPAKHRQLEDCNGTGLSRWLHYCEGHWKLYGSPIVLAVTEVERLQAEIERMRRDYALFEEMAPPDMPRSVFVKQCFAAWEKAATQTKQ